jgi:hypothetical protein
MGPTSASATGMLRQTSGPMGNTVASGIPGSTDTQDTDISTGVAVASIQRGVDP